MSWVSGVNGARIARQFQPNSLSEPQRKDQQMRRNFVTFAIAAAVTTALLTTPALAGKGGGHGGSTPSSYTITVTPGGPYSFGGTIYTTTNAPTSPDGSSLWLGLACYQNGVLVESGSHAAFAGGLGFNYPWVLGQTGLWTSGAGDCTVTAFHQSNNKIVTDATTSFHVDG
jgi:hypothetical protein